jgi:hypothetical protein
MDTRMACAAPHAWFEWRCACQSRRLLLLLLLAACATHNGRGRAKPASMQYKRRGKRRGTNRERVTYSSFLW